MSQIQSYIPGTGDAPIEKIEPSQGITVVPDAGGTIDMPGTLPIITTGTANTLTISVDGTVPTSFNTDSGTATPSGNALTLAGGTNINTAGATDTVTINLDDTVSIGQLDVDNVRINGNTISSTDTNGDITLTPDGTGTVNVSYLTQFTLPIAGSSGAINDLADGPGASGEVLTSNGAGVEPTWQAASGGGITWNEVTGTSQTMSADNGYIANNSSLVTLTLPSTISVGGVVRIAGQGSGGWRVDQNSGQTIHFLGSDTTTGTGGRLDSTNQYDAVELLCTVADNEFVAISSMGNITIT